jgi:alpha-beta hydrolase superfamily lysophospholipase
VGNSADDACTPQHTERLFEAIGHNRKAMVTIKGANHYYMGQPELAAQASAAVLSWLADQGFPI